MTGRRANQTGGHRSPPSFAGCADYVLDPTARVPEDCVDSLRHFLLVSKRGPDYQFAGAATLLLRALGFQARLISGFYAAPDAYDPLTRHTPIVGEDLHFWAEVSLASGDWLVVEATPGYDVLAPNLPLLERLAALLMGGLAWASHHGGELSFTLVALSLLWWRRRELLDGLAWRLWLWFPGRTWQQCLGRAVRLLEWRGAWAGQPRRPSQTVPAWLSAQFPGNECGQLAAMASWAAYGRDLTPPWDRAEVHGACRRALDAWPLRRWRPTRNGD